MFSTIVRDIFAVVGVVATLAGVGIGIIAYRAAKRGERRILREIKKKMRPRYVIGQVAGWLALRPRLGGSPPPQQTDAEPAHPAVSPPRQPKWPWWRPRPQDPSEVPWRPSPPEVDLPSYQTRPGPVEPVVTRPRPVGPTVTRPAPSEHFIPRDRESGFHLECPHLNRRPSAGLDHAGTSRPRTDNGPFHTEGQRKRLPLGVRRPSAGLDHAGTSRPRTTAPAECPGQAKAVSDVFLSL